MRKKVTLNQYMSDKNKFTKICGLMLVSTAANAAGNICGIQSANKQIKGLRYEIAKTQSKVNAVLIETNNLSADYKKIKKVLKKGYSHGKKSDGIKLRKKEYETINRMVNGKKN